MPLLITVHDAPMQQASDLACADGGMTDHTAAADQAHAPCMHGSQRQQRKHNGTANQHNSASQQQDGILALLTAALGVPEAAQQLNSKQDEDTPAEAPAAKRPRLESPPTNGPTQPSQEIEAAPSQAPEVSQATLVPLLQQQLQQLQETFWQRAWQGLQFYLGLSKQQEAGDAVAKLWGDFPPITALGPEEQLSLKLILEPVRQAEVAKTRELLARLQGLDSAPAGLPAAAAAVPPAAVAAPGVAASAVVAPAVLAPAVAPVQQARVRSRSGSPGAAPAQDVASAPAMDASDAAANAAANVPAAAATEQAAVKEEQQQHQQQFPDAASAGWLAQPDLQAWNAWLNPAAGAMYTMNGMNAAMYRPQGGRKPGGSVSAAVQHMWNMTQGTGAAGGLGAAATSGNSSQEGFSLRNPQYVGVYRSRRTEQGWRAQFSHANKVINLGTYDEAEDAARVWNEAALLLRGEGTWLNPVEPPLPEGYVRGELHLTSQKAVSAVKAAAAAAGLGEEVVAGVKLIA